MNSWGLEKCAIPRIGCAQQCVVLSTLVLCLLPLNSWCQARIGAGDEIMNLTIDGHDVLVSRATGYPHVEKVIFKQRDRVELAFHLLGAGGPGNSLRISPSADRGVSLRPATSGTLTLPRTRDNRAASLVYSDTRLFDSIVGIEPNIFAKGENINAVPSTAKSATMLNGDSEDGFRFWNDRNILPLLVGGEGNHFAYLEFDLGRYQGEFAEVINREKEEESERWEFFERAILEVKWRTMTRGEASAGQDFNFRGKLSRAVAHGNFLFFPVECLDKEYCLAVTDGTAHGTYLVKDSSKQIIPYSLNKKKGKESRIFALEDQSAHGTRLLFFRNQESESSKENLYEILKNGRVWSAVDLIADQTIPPIKKVSRSDELVFLQCRRRDSDPWEFYRLLLQDTASSRANVSKITFGLSESGARDILEIFPVADSLFLIMKGTGGSKLFKFWSSTDGDVARDLSGNDNELKKLLEQGATIVQSVAIDLNHVLGFAFEKASGRSIAFLVAHGPNKNAEVFFRKNVKKLWVIEDQSLDRGGLFYVRGGSGYFSTGQNLIRSLKGKWKKRGLKSDIDALKLNPPHSVDFMNLIDEGGDTYLVMASAPVDRDLQTAMTLIRNPKFRDGAENGISEDEKRSVEFTHRSISEGKVNADAKTYGTYPIGEDHMVKITAGIGRKATIVMKRPFVENVPFGLISFVELEDGFLPEESLIGDDFDAGEKKMHRIFGLGDRAVFSVDETDELWVTDGSRQGTMPLRASLGTSLACVQAKGNESYSWKRLFDSLDAETTGGDIYKFRRNLHEPSLGRPHSKSLSSVRFKVLRHGRTSLWLAGFGFQAAGAADEQVLSGHRRGLLHNTHICRCLEAYSSRGAFFSELQSGQIQAACSSSSRRRFFISMMRQKL